MSDVLKLNHTADSKNWTNFVQVFKVKEEETTLYEGMIKSGSKKSVY